MMETNNFYKRCKCVTSCIFLTKIRNFYQVTLPNLITKLLNLVTKLLSFVTKLLTFVTKLLSLQSPVTNTFTKMSYFYTFGFPWRLTWVVIYGSPLGLNAWSDPSVPSRGHVWWLPLTTPPYPYVWSWVYLSIHSFRFDSNVVYKFDIWWWIVVDLSFRHGLFLKLVKRLACLVVIV
jgi:hypothetical protein